ncbi:MAG: TolB family protein [Thermodesulfobacteriota bacterium]
MVKKLITCLTVIFLCISALALQADAGGLLAFVRDGNIWVAASDGSGARELTTSGQAEAPALSWDGKWVAFTSRAGDKVGIGLVSSAGGAVKRLTLPGIADAWSPAFFPDGKKLALVTRFNIRTETFDGDKQEMATHAVSVMDLDSGKLRHLVTYPNHLWDMGDIYENLVVSPDGRLIAYQESGTDVSGGFVVLNLQGRPVGRYPRNPEKDYRPFWRPTFSPDGGKMLCFSMAISEGEKTYIYLVDLQTWKATRITTGYYPTFVDGGKAIVFERWTETGRSGRAGTKIDLWRLDSSFGAQPRLILEDAEKPAGLGG